jgi:hypothetical protein
MWVAAHARCMQRCHPRQGPPLVQAPLALALVLVLLLALLCEPPAAAGP